MFGLLILLMVYALPVAVPAVAVIWVARERLPANIAKALAALAFIVGPAYALWGMEWFDVWRHGTPPPSYIVTAYGPYLACFAAVGWIAGGRLHDSRERSIH